MLLLACAAPDVPAGPRVVSLHDTTTEIVVGLGRAADLAAITEPRFLSDAAAAAVADVPRLPGGPLSGEGLRALHPTLVLGTDVVDEQTPALRPQLGAVPVLFVDPAGLDGLFAAVDQVAAALDADPAAYRDALAARIPAPADGPRLRVALYDCCDPPFVAGGRVPLTALLDRLGADNVFGRLDQDWAHVSWEALVGARPDLVVVHDYAWDGQGDTAAKIAALRDHGVTAPTVVLPLALALEGPRTLEAPAVLAPALAAARARAGLATPVLPTAGRPLATLPTATLPTAAP
ncbi:MAG: ABC transporter substrate-binding protein [Myxococcota bacterium]